MITPPGERVRVHVPADGSPFKIMLPVDTVQFGWMIVPTTGAAGADECELITTFADAADVQVARVTVKVYVPVPNPETVAVVPVPVVVTPPGIRVKVQLPVAGNPFNITLPVATEHVG